MSATTTHETRIEADPALPTVRVTRDFDAPPERVFRVWTEPELVAQWLGPRNTEWRVDTWDARTGGSYRLCGTARRPAHCLVLRLVPRAAAR